jgi:hypothetical protein
MLQGCTVIHRGHGRLGSPPEHGRRVLAANFVDGLGSLTMRYYAFYLRVLVLSHGSCRISRYDDNDSDNDARLLLRRAVNP